jgi:DNA-directed RNA polymerase subunit RPC12/RpoP
MRTLRPPGSTAYRCAACGQRIGVLRRSTDESDEGAVTRIKSMGLWRCPNCGGTSLELADA